MAIGGVLSRRFVLCCVIALSLTALMRAPTAVLILDSRNAEAVGAALRNLRFDIIIDDGFHNPEAQRRTFAALRSHLKPTGVYVIEDVYEIDADRYLERGMDVTIHPDKSGQSLVVLYPSASLARGTDVYQNRSHA